MFSSFLIYATVLVYPYIFIILCYLERDFLFFVVRFVFLRTFLAVFACQSLNMFIFLCYVRLAIGYLS